jgi:DNA-binding NtrC family response regulator
LRPGVASRTFFVPNRNRRRIVAHSLEDGSDHVLIGSSPVMQGVLAIIARLAVVPWAVRIEGPSGTGKRVAARMLHALSARAAEPFVRCNLNMIADGREHAELVGWVRGAFTGAVSDHAGDFEAAHHGMLLLDEIGAATPKVQLALLQLVDEGAVRRIGDHRVRYVDVRLVYATNADLEVEVAAGRFREDLFFRLGRHVLRMPALAEHREDIPDLVSVILDRKAQEAALPGRAPSAAEMEQLIAYDWPGNVRELEHAIEHFVTWGRLPPNLARDGLRSVWRRRVDQVLARHDGNKTAAARELGISRQTLYEELQRREVLRSS